MTDRDVVLRAHALLGTSNTVGTNMPEKGTKPAHFFSINGSVAAGWMMTLWPMLGERRRARVVEVLGAWRSAKRRNRRGHECCINGHRMDAANSYIHPGNAQVSCRKCRLQSQRSYRLRQREATT